MEGDPLQSFRSHDRSDASSSKGTAVLAFDHGKSDAILSGRSNDQRPGFLLPDLFKNGFFCLKGSFSPEVFGRMENDLLVTDFKKDRLSRPSFNDDGIIPRPADGKGDLSSRVRLGIDPGLGRFGEDGITA